MYHAPIHRYAFHVSRHARQQYGLDESLFSLRGRIVFAHFQAARLLAQRINARRDLLRHPEQAVSAAQLNALGLLHEILHLLIQRYRQQQPQVLQQALAALDRQPGRAAVDRTLARFAEEFPPLPIYRGEVSVEDYLAGASEGISHREVLLEELLLLWLSNSNPAAEPLRELFDDEPLETQTAYHQVIDALQRFFAAQPGFEGAAGGPQGDHLIAVLRAPILASPHSLIGQLEYLRQRYGFVLGALLQRLLVSLDFIREEQQTRIGVGGPGPIQIADYRGLEAEPERYTPDREWMPRLVLIAKNAFVWLDQLTKKYRRPITTLDQVPDEELDALARAGISGLWLIGLWERSRASRRIKQLMGNPDAVASAYSLYDYVIAEDLGGEAACDNLRRRAWQRGIRLASDMVPNHMGIDSRWVIEHPERFLSLPYPPYPSYTFSGPDLSDDPRVGIFLEDHYYTRTDAAVVFKRVDRQTGEERYIYHGNDGTSMPWNDTAQLNYLRPDVREAVIQTILHVARQFPIIRFDAAMTLTKKHYQRLWFPEPGSGGAIPSRAEHAMTKAEFDAAMPEEFWREVVDRCAAEAPDTLLLAEAFWLMENYFVRTLGMHRVYNSAFMHLLRDEDNAKYRQIMKQTLEFDPEIMKRWVNFMNNPDEQTAVAQFGKGDKYFGICTLMVTLPGLPMFGHGQIEGFAEKYGMEYRRAYWDEQPDTHLIARHEREIFPLLHRRALFAEVGNFRLYDLHGDGGVNEDVFAFSNRAGEERALVIYHNRYAATAGWIHTSAPFAVKQANGDKTLRQETLGAALGLHNDERWFCIFRDQGSDLEYIRSSRELHERGLFVSLGAYQRHVFVDFREVEDNASGQYRQLLHALGGRGVPSIEEAAHELVLQPILAPFRELVNADLWRRLLEARALPQPPLPTTPTAPARLQETPEAARATEAALLDEVSACLTRLLAGLQRFTGLTGDIGAIVAATRADLAAWLALPSLAETVVAMAGDPVAEALAWLGRDYDDLTRWTPLLGWSMLHRLGALANPAAPAAQTRAWLEEWRLDRSVAATLQELGLDGAPAWRATQGLKLLLDGEALFGEAAPTEPRALLEHMLRQPELQAFLGVHRYQGVLYFNKEAFELVLWWMLALAALGHLRRSRPPATLLQALAPRVALIRQLQAAEARSEYQVERLLAAAGNDAAPAVEGADPPLPA
ncbi:alpha-amylase family glycosyl hydrolase [Kallotenue papyrolyticum]|uniref:alpha-amylase family glycosyl hydrolase n=1 Tax=Kallotenue papyrolyticum TaxID=1325125 RepID=UPI0004926B4B|nr:alpha-amylase family glycosyl hydrolase [Kallotenue papyrolyticum]